MVNFTDSGVALITPFTKNNKINYDKIDELIEYHICNNTDFIVVCGTTGESSTLSNTEKKQLISYVCKKCKNKISVVAGTGSNNTKIALNMSKYAKSQGADGVLVVTPYYNKCNQNGLFVHYKKIAEAIYPTPLILYNVPSRTGVDISVETIVKLSKIPNIVAIKEANPSLEKIAQVINKTKDTDFNVLSGNDNLIIPILSLGGKGVISVCANIIPNEMHNICIKKDVDLFYKYLDLMDSLFLDVNPIMIKEAMNYLNFSVGKTRLPLYEPDTVKVLKMQKIIDETF